MIAPQHYRFVNVATFGLAIQLSLMYITSYVHKTGDEWTTTRIATQLALQIEYFTTFVSEIFLMFPEMLKYLTAAVLWWEGFGSLFWFCPVFSGPLKAFGTIGFFGKHVISKCGKKEDRLSIVFS